MPILTLLVQPESEQKKVIINKFKEKFIILNRKNAISNISLEINTTNDIKHITIVLPCLIREKNIVNQTQDIIKLECNNKKNYSTITAEVIKRPSDNFEISFSVACSGFLRVDNRGIYFPWHIANLKRLNKCTGMQKYCSAELTPKFSCSNFEQTLICPPNFDLIDASLIGDQEELDTNDIDEIKDINHKLWRKIQKNGHKWTWNGFDDEDKSGFFSASKRKRCNVIYLRGKLSKELILSICSIIIAIISLLASVSAFLIYK